MFLHTTGQPSTLVWATKIRPLEWLARAHDERSGLLIYLNVEPVFDNVRSDPRFAELLRRVRLSRE